MSSMEAKSDTQEAYAPVEQQNPDNEEPKKIKEAKAPDPAIPFYKLFAFADKLDYLLMFVGSTGAIVQGLARPIFLVLLFGYLVNSFGSYTENPGKMYHEVTKYVLYFVYLGIISLVASWAEVACWIQTGERQTTRMRISYLEAMLKQDIEYFDVEGIANKLVESMNTDTLIIQEAISEKMGAFIHSMSTFLGGLILGFVTVWQLCLLTIAIVPVIAICGGLYAYALMGVNAKSQAAYANAGGIAEQAISQVRTVYSFVGEAKATNSYTQALKSTVKLGYKAGLAKGIGVGVTYGVLFCCWALLLWYGGVLVRKGTADGGKILAAIFVVIVGGLALGQASPNFEAFSKARAAGYQIMEVINHKSTMNEDCLKGEVLPVVQGNIEFRNVSFSYPSRPGVAIFQNLSLRIPAGKVVAVVGGSGSGKSTIISLINRFYDPTSGNVLLDDHDIRTLQLVWLRAQMGLVSQEPVLFTTTIEENILHGNEKATLEDIEKAARSANIHEFISQLPQGYKTQVGERGIQLSGGQKQRIAIARAMLKSPSILLLDEATSALDAESEETVQQALNKLMRGRTTVIVAHRLSTIQDADIIAVLQEGVIVELGTHDELIAKGDLGEYAALVKLQEGSDNAEAKTFSRTPTMTPRGGFTSPRTPPRGGFTSPRTPPRGGFTSPWTPRGGGFTSPRTPRGGGFLPPGSEMGFLSPRSFLSPRKSALDGTSHFSFKRIESFVTETYAPEPEPYIIHQSSTGSDTMLIQDNPKSKAYFWRLLKLNAPEWPFFTVGAVGAMFSGVVAPVFAFLIASNMKMYYDTDYHRMKREIAKFSIIFSCVGGGTFIAYFVEQYFFAIAGENLTKRVREAMLGAILRNEVSWFDEDENTSSQLASRLGSRATLVRAAMGDRIGMIVTNVTLLITAFLIAFIVQWKVAFVVGATLPLLVASAVSEQLFLKGFAGDIAKAHDRATMLADEAIYNIRIVKSFHAEKKLIHLLSTELSGPKKSSFIRGQIAGFGSGIARLFLFWSHGLGLWYGARLIRDGEATFGDVMKSYFILIMTSYAIAETIGLAPDIVNSNNAMRSVFEILDRKTKIDPEDPASEHINEVKGDIEFIRVVFYYPSRPDIPVFNNLNLKLHSGRTLALVGPSGSGKSSIISLVERFYDPVAGVILIDGKDIRNLNLRSYRKHVGLVQQEPALFATTIYENIIYGKEYATEDEVIEAAKAANAHNFVSALPDGYKTHVGERGAQLSGGQKQRIAIARAVLKNPAILLLDEATSALDAESEHVVQEAVDRLMKGRTTIAVAHRLSTIKNANKIAVIQDGKIIEQGNHESLIKDEESTYHRLFKLQQGSKRESRRANYLSNTPQDSSFITGNDQS